MGCWRTSVVDAVGAEPSGEDTRVRCLGTAVVGLRAASRRRYLGRQDTLAALQGRIEFLQGRIRSIMFGQAAADEQRRHSTDNTASHV